MKAQKRTSNKYVLAGFVFGIIAMGIMVYSLGYIGNSNVTLENATEHIQAKLPGFEIKILSISEKRVCQFGNLYCTQTVEFLAISPMGKAEDGLAVCNSRSCRLIPQF